MWYFSLPLVGVISLASIATYPRYTRLTTSKELLLFYAGVTLAVDVVAWVLLIVLGELGLHRWLYDAM